MPTIKDVAQKAGVSVGTVSMVINENPSVKMETRVHVLNVIEEMGYSPNQYARSLVTRKRNVIGIIRAKVTSESDAYRCGYHFDEIPETYLADMQDDIVGEMTRVGYSILLDVAAWSMNDDPRLTKLPPIVEQGRIDGLIWAGGFMTARQLELLKKVSVPVVTIGARFDCFDWVDTDPEEGMYLMTKHVLSCGHTRVAFINGLSDTQTSERKLRGFTRAMEEAGVRQDPEYLEQAAFSGLGGYNALRRIWERGLRPTAVVTALDVLAVGAMRFLAQNGLNVPGDISVTGFEDGMLAEYANPPLTTVHTRKKELGLQASRTLANRLENPKAQRVRLIIRPELAIRETVRKL